MKIGYFNHSSINVSETFIYDLLKRLNNLTGNGVTYFSGSNEPINLDFNIDIKVTGFYKSSFALKFLENLSLKFKFFSQYYFLINKYFLHRKLKRNKADKINVAYVDYASNGILLMDFFKKHKIPFAVHVHGFDVTSKMRDNFYREKFKKLIDLTRFFIVASNSMKRILILHGCPKSKIKLVRLGVDMQRIKPVSWDEKFKNHNHIISLGRLTPKKNPIASLYAFKIVNDIIPESKYTIIGDGELKNDLQKKIIDLNLQGKVFMLGSLNRKKAFNILKDKTVFIQHSVTPYSGDQEGFAISIAEAQMFEIPIVSTIHNGISENVINNKTGFLVQEYNFEDMAEKIIYLLKNKSVCKRFGRAGRKHITKLCDNFNRAKNIYDILIKMNYNGQ